MEVHETSWPLADHGAMTAAATGDGVTGTQPSQRHGSTSHDQDWTDFLRSCSQNGGLDPTATTTSNTDNMNYALLGFDDNMPTQFGAMQDFQDADPASTATSSSHSSSISDPNGASHPFQNWPMVTNAPVMTYEHGPFHPAPFMPENHQHQYHPSINFAMHGGDGLGIHMPPTSHPFSQEQQHAMQFNGAYFDHGSPIHHQHEFAHNMAPAWEQHEQSVPPQDDLFGDEEDREADPADPCYAQLLYQCLKEAPNYTLSLRELYDWVSQHSQKAKDPKNRGWQNSVRHNLSMNAAFARVPHGTGTGTKKGSLWRLTDEALRDGVISTTRYRKDPKRKPDRRPGTSPALNRQASGAKGGRATRDATRFRQAQQQQRSNRPRFHPANFPHGRPRHGAQYSPYSIHSRSAETSPQPAFVPSTPTSPYFIDEPAGLPPLPTSAPQTPPSQEEWEAQFVGYQPKHMPPAGYFGAPPEPVFEFLPFDYQAGLFGDRDQELHGQHASGTPTPSLMTEASAELQPPSSVLIEGEGNGF